MRELLVGLVSRTCFADWCDDKTLALRTRIGRRNQRVKNKPKEWIIPWAVDDKKYERYNYIYDKDELEKQLNDVGFEVVSIEEKENIIAIVRKN